MTESKYYHRMLLRGPFYARNQTVSYFDSMTGFGRTEPFSYPNICLLPAAAFKYFM